MAVFAGQVAASSDDAIQNPSNGVVLTDTNTTMSTTDSVWVGLRFLNLTIPRGAVVSAADIQLRHSTGTKAVAYDMTIQAEAIDDSVTFTTAASNISSRTRTTASVTWTATISSTTQFNTSPGISTVIQEVLNRALWVSGNDLNIILGARSTSQGSLDLFDSGSANAAKLDITYTLAAPPQPRPRRVFQAVNRSGTY